MDLLRQTIFPEYSNKYLFCVLSVSCMHTLRGKHIASTGIGNGKGITVLFVAHSELTFKISTPYFIWFLRIKYRFVRFYFISALTLFDHTMLVKYFIQRSFRGYCLMRKFIFQ